MNKVGRPSTQHERICASCGSAFSTNAKSARKFCNRECYSRSEIAKANGRNTGSLLKGRPTNNPNGNGGATKGRPANERQRQGLAVGWAAVKSGPENRFWKGGKMAERPHQSSAAHRRWRRQIIARDECCVFCGAVDELQADHIKPVMLYPELALDLNNGRALCAPCHRKTDTYAGRVHKMQRAVI